MMISEFLPTIIFFGIIFLVIFWIVYSAKTLDRKLQSTLKSIFIQRSFIRFGNIENEKRYLKKIGEGDFKNRKFNLFTNNNEAFLNRQVIFEFSLNKEISKPFVITRNPNQRTKRKVEENWKRHIHIYEIPFSEMYKFGRRLQMALETLGQKNAEKTFQILEKSKVQNRISEIPPFLKVFRFNAFNSHWKIFCEKNRIGVEIESSWIKTITFPELENFLEIVCSIADSLEENEESPF